MAKSKLFEYEVNNFDDVRDHLDALWYEFNQLVGPSQGCTNPPDTCGFQEKAKAPAKRGQRKRPVKRAKP
jgi:hypothetical protein